MLSCLLILDGKSGFGALELLSIYTKRSDPSERVASRISVCVGRSRRTTSQRMMGLLKRSADVHDTGKLRGRCLSSDLEAREIASGYWEVGTTEQGGDRARAMCG